MEVVASILGSAVAEGGHVLCGPFCSKINNTVKIQSNLQALEKELEVLIGLRDDMICQLALAEKDGKVPRTQVKAWVRSVDEFIFEVDLMQESVRAKEKKHYCFYSCCPQYRHGSKVARMLKEVQGLKSEGIFPQAW